MWVGYPPAERGVCRALPSAVTSDSAASHSCHRCTEGNTDAWLRKDRLCLSLFHPLSEKALCSHVLFPEGATKENISTLFRLPGLVKIQD